MSSDWLQQASVEDSQSLAADTRLRSQGLVSDNEAKEQRRRHRRRGGSDVDGRLSERAQKTVRTGLILLRMGTLLLLLYCCVAQRSSGAASARGKAAGGGGEAHSEQH